MFPTRSVVTQIKPETVCQIVLEAEERQWRQIEFRQFEESGSEQEDLALALLRHGTNVKKINHFFSSLESRKFCMLLAGRKSTFGKLHLVNTDKTQEEDVIDKNRREIQTVSQLNSKEFQAFKHAYLCATYPVLGAPDPPSPYSPAPSFSYSEKKFSYATMKCPIRPTTPYSLQDSGVEDQDEMAVIPTETLCDLVQKSFGLTSSKYRQYEKIIISSSLKKSSQKMLAEELFNQLTALENNSNAFYNPHTFLTRNGYDIWQQHERSQISEHFDKFWHFSLPFPSGQESVTSREQPVHNDYNLLLHKLLAYESLSNSEESEIDRPLYGMLSSASMRLLKEFGLRFGIGDQYRKIVYLKYLTENFSFNVWFLRHVLCAVIGIYDMFPSNRSNLVMVMEEYLMLQECIESIIIQASRGITQMKTLFPNNKPREGIEMLLELISVGHNMKSYLTLDRRPAMQDYILSLIQRIFEPAYEKHKVMAQNDLDEEKNQILSPKLLNILINDVRDEINDYKTNYQQTFESFFNITELAAKSFYHLLMNDIKIFLNFEKTNKPSDINLLMLGLAFRLNQLDQEFKHYIPPKAQIWRTCFHGEVIQWGVSFKIQLKDLILQSVGEDKFVGKQLHLERPFSQMSSTGRRSFSTSYISFTPSVNSAFSSVSSSIRSSPYIKNPFQRTHVVTENVGKNNSAITTPRHDEIPIKFISSFKYDTQSLNSFSGCVIKEEEEDDECLTFGAIKYSSSLPDITHIQEKTNSRNGATMAATNQSIEDKNKTDQFSLPPSSSIGFDFDLANSYHIEQKHLEEELDSEIEDNEYDLMKSCENAVSHIDSPVSDKGEFSFPAISQVTDTGNRKLTMPYSETHHSSSGFFSKIYSAFFPPQFSASTLYTVSKDDVGDVLNTSSSETGETNQKTEFLDSLASDFTNMTLPELPSSDVFLPLSGSVIDIFVILQRNIYFVQMLCDMVYPAFYTDETCEDSSVVQIRNQLLRAKQDTYSTFLKTMRDSVCLYVDNMLCLDLCGTPLSISKKIIGPQLVEHIQTQKMNEVVWGCRHQIDNLDCRQFIDRNTAYLCDRYEPISEQMCARINNVHALYKVMSFYEHKLHKAVNVEMEENNEEDYLHQQQSGRESKMSQTSNISVFESILGADEEDFTNSSYGKVIASNPCQTHIMSVLKSMVRLLAFRLSLFIKDALPLLLKLRINGVTIGTCLQPLTDFLSNYLTSLSMWLYKNCFYLVQEQIWIFIVQCFESEADRLKKDDYTSQNQAETLLQAMTYLMKFMNNSENGIQKKLLLAQAEDVILKLQLYTLSTRHLLTLYQILTHKTDKADYDIQIDPALSSLLFKITTSLESRSKCFSGQILVNWLIYHKSLVQKIDPIYNVGPFYREKAAELCQKLLNLQILIDVDMNIKGRSMTPLSVSSLEGDYYPGVTIFSNQYNHLTTFSSDEDEDEKTPIPSPVTTATQYQPHVAMSTSGREKPAEQTQVYVDVPIQVQSLNLLPEIVCDKNVDTNSPETGAKSTCRIETTTDEHLVKGTMSASGTVKDSLTDVNKDYLIGYQETVKLPLPPDHHLESMSNSDSNRTISLNSCSSSGKTVQFHDKKNHFYRVSENYAYGNHHFSAVRTQKQTESKSDKSFSKTDSLEMVHLAEQCFLKKIYPVSILTIIYCRRKQDSGAKSVIKQLPSQVIDNIKTHIDIPSNNCIAS